MTQIFALWFPHPHIERPKENSNLEFVQEQGSNWELPQFKMSRLGVFEILLTQTLLEKLKWIFDKINQIVNTFSLYEGCTKCCKFVDIFCCITEVQQIKFSSSQKYGVVHFQINFFWNRAQATFTEYFYLSKVVILQWPIFRSS